MGWRAGGEAYACAFVNGWPANEDVMGLALESAAATTTWWVLGCEAPMECVCVCVWRGWGCGVGGNGKGTVLHLSFLNLIGQASDDVVHSSSVQ